MFEKFTEESKLVFRLANTRAHSAGRQAQSNDILRAVITVDPAFIAYLLSSKAPEAIGSIAELDPEEFNSDPTPGGFNGACISIGSLAFSEAEREGSREVEPKHLVLGILREQTCSAARHLKTYGINLDSAREGSKNWKIIQGYQPKREARDQCAITITMEGYDSPHVIIATDQIGENGTVHAVDIARGWLEQTGWHPSPTRKHHCYGYFEKEGSRAYVTSKLFTIENLIPANN